MRSRKHLLNIATILALATLAFFGSARAQVNSEPPGVARVSFVRGDVSMQRGDSGDTSAVELNTPMEGGDKIFTGSRARAEIQLDWANMLRLDENAQADIATLETKRIQVQLSQGLATFSVLEGSEADIEIDTPNVAISPRRAGRYRIEVTASGDTLITVREGEAEISTPDGSTALKAGDLITVRGTGRDVQFQIARAFGPDEFDRWNSDRDRLISNAESYRRANRYYPGASDLDAYGHWDNVDDYGWVWVPRVAVDWAPYRHGRWVWTAYWGWTWTADEPWGWAPYHYGRWFVHSGNWVWWPGPVTPIYRPVYAPAYVSFFGFGARSGINVGLSFGGYTSIGWLPVGPCDYVNPWWGPHRGNFNVVNVTNITNVYNVRNVNVIAPLRGGDRDSNIHNLLRDNQVRFGLSTVSPENFGRGRAEVRHVGVAELQQGRFMTGNVPIVPTRDSLRTSDRTVVAGAARPQGETHFFSRRAPSSQHESFSNESARVQQGISPFAEGSGNRAAEGRPADNRPSSNSALAGERNGGPAMNAQRQQGFQTSQQPQAQPSEAGGGWQRFGAGQRPRIEIQGNPRNDGSVNQAAQNRANAQQSQAPPRASDRPQTPPQSGWQRFSGPPAGANSFRGQGDSEQQGPQTPPRYANRPQLELNRPIIEPRAFRGGEPGPSRPPAANNYRRVEPGPQAPSYSSRPAPGGNSGEGPRSAGPQARGNARSGRGR